MRKININVSLVEAAEEEIRSTANEIFLSSTLDGDWQGDTDSQEKHDYLIELADRLAGAQA